MTRFITQEKETYLKKKKKKTVRRECGEREDGGGKGGKRRQQTTVNEPGGLNRPVCGMGKVSKTSSL